MRVVLTPEAASSIEPVRPPVLPDLAEMLTDLRLRAGMTQTAVAEVIGVGRSSVTNMETGRQPVTLEHVDALARHLGLEVTLTIAKQSEPTND